MSELNATPLEWKDEYVKRFWDYYSSQDSKYFASQFGEYILKQVPHISDDNHVMDYGCGTRGLLPHLLNRFHYVHATEFSADSIKKVNQLYSKYRGFG